MHIYINRYRCMYIYIHFLYGVCVCVSIFIHINLNTQIMRFCASHPSPDARQESVWKTNLPIQFCRLLCVQLIMALMVRASLINVTCYVTFMTKAQTYNIKRPVHHESLIL